VTFFMWHNFSSVAAWLSETVLRSRGPSASEFESHRRGRVFFKEGATLSRPPPRGRQGSNPGGMGHPWMSCCVHIVSSRKEKGEKRVGVGGRGKYPGAPPHHLNKKRGEEADRPGVVKGECYKKKFSQL
jgi:hypothetical protein